MKKQIAPITIVLVNILFLFTIACTKKSEKKEETLSIEKPNYIVDIVTKNMDFQMKDTLLSGWNHFKYQNLSSQTHFFLIDKYPVGKTSEDAKKLVAPIFDNGMKLIMEGKPNEGFAEFAKLPKWFNEVVFMGGSGLISPDKTSETMIYLNPGNYIVECYVKMSNGMFHTSMGMAKDLIVIDQKTKFSPPKEDVTIEVSSTNGIEVSNAIAAGKKLFKVYYKDQTVHENFVGHDVHLVKIDDNANLDELEIWMNWADPKGLIEPAPKGVTFLGGVNDLPKDNFAYFTANLMPGNYALISEVPNSRGKKLFYSFKIEIKH